MLKSGFAIALACLLVVASAAVAQDEVSSVPDELQGMVGPWSLEQEDPALPKCALTFTETQVPGGWAIEVPDACPAPFPSAASLAAWNIDAENGSVLVLDPGGNVTLRLLEDEDGLYDTTADVQPRFYLLPPYDEDLTGGEADGL